MKPFSHQAAAAAGSLVLAAALAASGCQNGKAEESAAGAPGAGMPPPEVTVVTVEPQTVPVPYELSGRLEGSREVEVRARVSGILLERTYEEGRPVRQGETLFVIDPAPYRAVVQAAQAELAEEQAGLSRAEREAKRLEPLIAQRAVSRKDYDNAVSDAEEARAAVGSARARLEQAQLDLSYTRVEAPVAGLSSRAEHSEGSLVSPGEGGLLTRIVQVRPIWVRFSVSESQLPQLRQASAARRAAGGAGEGELEVELVLADGSTHPERGRLNFADSMIDAATGSVALRAEVPNAEGRLVPGQFVQVRLVGIERPDTLVVPQRAVQQGPEGKFVFVVDETGKAQMRPIEVGQWIGQDWIVEAGISAGDRVIVDGTVKVQPGAPVTIAASAPDPNAPPAQAAGAASTDAGAAR